MKLISRSIEGKQLVWFEQSNKYIRMEAPAYEVFTQLNNSICAEDISAWISERYKISTAEAENFVNEVKDFVQVANQPAREAVDFDFPGDDKIPVGSDLYSIKHYQFSGTDFSFHYGHKRIEQMVHPLLAHLEVESSQIENHVFQLFRLEDDLFLRTDGNFIGRWGIRDQHYFKGKVFLEILNKSYRKEEEDWMAVLHASAIRFEDSALLFAGKSGSGKSTALSLLMAKGFDFLADDFVPLDYESSNVYPFPIAISVKEGAARILENSYPELKHAETFNYEAAKKKVKYLSPTKFKHDSKKGTKVKGIVFVNYEAGASLKLEAISKNEALQQLVPESWVSPLYKNAKRFLDWFVELPCYNLKYSDNDQMAFTILKLFNDEV